MKLILSSLLAASAIAINLNNQLSYPSELNCSTLDVTPYFLSTDSYTQMHLDWLKGANLKALYPVNSSDLVDESVRSFLVKAQLNGHFIVMKMNTSVLGGITGGFREEWKFNDTTKANVAVQTEITKFQRAGLIPSAIQWVDVESFYFYFTRMGPFLKRPLLNTLILPPVYIYETDGYINSGCAACAESILSRWYELRVTKTYFANNYNRSIEFLDRRRNETSKFTTAAQWESVSFMDRTLTDLFMNQCNVTRQSTIPKNETIDGDGKTVFNGTIFTSDARHSTYSVGLISFVTLLALAF